MHNVLLTALAAAVIFAIGMIAGQAEALPAATSPLAGVARSSLVREAAIVCGGNGCNPVHTKAVKRNKFKPLEYTKPVGKAS